MGHEEAGVEPRAPLQGQEFHLPEEVGEGRVLLGEEGEPGPLQEGEGAKAPGKGKSGVAQGLPEAAKPP